MRVCDLRGCAKEHHAHGLCRGHHHRLKKYGDPYAGSTEKGAPQRFFLEARKSVSNDCILWPFGTVVSRSSVYAVVYVSEPREQVLAHRLMCELVHGKPDADNQAAHSCGNGLCINPHHLRWATRRENEADKLIHGTHQLGERNAQAKLTPDQVIEILSLKGIVRQAELATRFGVKRPTISSIHTGKSWSHLMRSKRDCRRAA